MLQIFSNHSGWKRERLSTLLSPDGGEVTAVRTAADRGRWNLVHAELMRYFANAPRRFAISPAIRAEAAANIRRVFPSAMEDAAGRADLILTGCYELLGYRRLRFDRDDGSQPDWL